MNKAIPISDEKLDMLICDVRRMHGYDFSGYTRQSLKRRISRILLIEKMYTFEELRFKILNYPDFIYEFIKAVTINYTEIFRDPAFFSSLRSDVLPYLNTFPLIRIWLAGCSTGEEAYSVAIMLKELGLYHKSLIYATDVNSAVLEAANKGIYPVENVRKYSANYIAAGGSRELSFYYNSNYGHVAFHKELKENIIFSTHNLVSDASFNSFQLILCRNVLIYFDRELQNQVFDLFDTSLENNGFLTLGTKETIHFSERMRHFEQIGNEKIWKKVKLFNSPSVRGVKTFPYE